MLLFAGGAEVIRLVNLLTAAGVCFDQEATKVHLACWNGEQHPIDVFYAGNFQSWQEWQTRRNFTCKYVLSLIDLGASTWLFAGVYSIVDVASHPTHVGHFLYSTLLLPGQENLIGRIIVHHSRTRQSYIWMKPEIDLPVLELRRERMTIEEFPGYNSICISHPTLQTIIRQRIASWHGALANIKGIYLIADTSTGCLYVGKASGQIGIWQRWTSYSETGHGGNVQLKQLLRINGPEHVNHFQYSILEIADNHASEADIQARESHWMNVLRTRAFGLN